MTIDSKGLVFLLSGPAGSGKTTLCHRLIREFPNLERAVTVTTRQPREGEREGIDYYFLGMDAFRKARENEEFLESALVHGRAYGTYRREVEDRIRSGRDVLLSIDVQGMRQIRTAAGKEDWLMNRLVSVFILPPSLDELRRRLRQRNSDDDDEIERRIRTAQNEIEHAREFSFILETHAMDDDFDRVRAIYLAEKMRVR